MPKAYSADIRMRVIARVEGGASRREAAEQLDISPKCGSQMGEVFSRDWELRIQAARREHVAIGGTCALAAHAD